MFEARNLVKCFQVTDLVPASTTEQKDRSSVRVTERLWPSTVDRCRDLRPDAEEVRVVEGVGAQPGPLGYAALEPAPLHLRSRRTPDAGDIF